MFNREKRIERRRYILGRIKIAYGCDECGYNTHDVALHFAHIDPMTKSPKCYGKSGRGKQGAAMGRLYTRVLKDQIKNRQAIKDIFLEIRKCKILCANCHAIETYERGEHKNSMVTARTRAVIIEQPTDTQRDMFL